MGAPRPGFASDDGISWMSWDGSGVAEPLTTGEHSTIPGFPGSWTPDGTTLALVVFQKETEEDVWLFTKGDGLDPLLHSIFNESYPVFSPDGRWLDYTSDETGRREVYVQPHPGPGARVQISMHGGSSPAWAGNGKALFYVGILDSNALRPMMAVDIVTGPVIRASRPRLLFRGR
jgi:Tol biopolymer transport system component